MKPLAIVTGASTGIGKASAARLLANGWDVINVSRRDCELEGVRNITADLAEPLADDVQRQLTEAGAASVRCAIVHSAGYLSGDHAQSLTRTNLEQSLAVNTVAPAVLNQLMIAHMKPGSAIIFVGSTLGDKAVAGSLSYVTSKHAVNGLMRATCQDLAGSGIHTAVVSPGFTDTAMLRAHVGEDQAVLNAIAENVTQGRLIRPDEIAGTIAFCIDNPVINGAVIHANLGQIER